MESFGKVQMYSIQGFHLYFDPHPEAKQMTLAKTVKNENCRVFRVISFRDIYKNIWFVGIWMSRF